jgi:hypothetical protein
MVREISLDGFKIKVHMSKKERLTGEEEHGIFILIPDISPISGIVDILMKREYS